MIQIVEASTMTSDEYLVWEELQEEKHEYVHGEIFAMGGARREHVQVAGNIFAVLKQQLRGTPCRAYISDMKLHISTMDAYFYPDVIVSCHKEDHKAEQSLSFPRSIIEVLSDSTEAYDRGAKFTAYRSIESLTEYILVDIKTRSVECFRRTANNDWLLHVYVEEEECKLESLDISIEMTDIFEDIVDI